MRFVFVFTHGPEKGREGEGEEVGGGERGCKCLRAQRGTRKNKTVCMCVLT